MAAHPIRGLAHRFGSWLENHPTLVRGSLIVVSILIGLAAPSGFVYSNYIAKPDLVAFPVRDIQRRSSPEVRLQIHNRGRANAENVICKFQDLNTEIVDWDTLGPEVWDKQKEHQATPDRLALSTKRITRGSTETIVLFVSDPIYLRPDQVSVVSEAGVAKVLAKQPATPQFPGAGALALVICLVALSIVLQIAGFWYIIRRLQRLPPGDYE